MKYKYNNNDDDDNTAVGCDSVVAVIELIRNERNKVLLCIFIDYVIL